MTEHQSWDSFWAEVEREKATEVICGVTVTVPTDIPLSFDRRLTELNDSSSEDDIRALVTELYGADVLDRWIDNGMTALGFRTALGWGVARAKGRELSFREAFDLLKQAEDGQGNPPAANREQRRAAQRQQSASTGGRSKPTSRASTGSGQRRSRH